MSWIRKQQQQRPVDDNNSKKNYNKMAKSKQIEKFEAWGYTVEINATGFKKVVFSGARHTNIYHKNAGGRDSSIPINTFAVTNEAGLLIIPRAFNGDAEYDPRRKGEKLALRDQIVSFWHGVEGRSLKDLKRIKYTGVIEENLRDHIEEVYDMLGKDEEEDVTVRRSEKAFRLLASTTPFLAGAQKMLDDYADHFSGKKIESCEFEPIGGFELFNFIITLT